MTNINNRNRMIPKSNGGKGIIKSLLIFLLIIAIGGLAVFFFLYKSYESRIIEPLIMGADETSISFGIPEGASFEEITAVLIESGILPENREQEFKLYVKLNDIGHLFQAGSFSIKNSVSITELAAYLQSAGMSKVVWVTIPEGLRNDEQASLLAIAFEDHEGSIFSEEQFMTLTTDPEYIAALKLPFQAENGAPTSLEGYLFPDRYQFEIESSEATVIETMLNNFNAKLPAGQEFTYTHLILASMLEREGRQEDERVMISDIIQRRFEEGWLLNIDATLLYYQKDWKHVITQTNLDTDQPYNTYTRQGYPPTPIANPGADSLFAAVNPEPNEFYYYMHDNDGQIHYAETYAEHNANVNKYLR